MTARRWRVVTGLDHLLAVSDNSKMCWTVIDGTAVFLDIAADRYFRLPPDRNAQFVAEMSDGTVPPVQPVAIPRPEQWQLPQSLSAAISEGHFRLGETARAIWMQRRVERQLAVRPFSEIVGNVSRALARSACPESRGEEGASIIRAFEHAKLIRTAADRCLPRSIALSLCLARRRIAAHVVLGVKLAPFAAHCWVQCSGEVLNDSLEEVQRYSPILVL